MLNCRNFIRPLGLLRILETLLSIVSFACTAGFYGSLGFAVTCASATSESVMVSWAYPFSLSTSTLDASLCNGSTGLGQNFQPVFFIDFGAQAQFFVFVGVCSFLVSLIWLIGYVGFWRAYAMDTLLPTADLVTSIITALFWLCADCSWASSYRTLQMYLAVPQIHQSVLAFPFCQNGNTCAVEGEKLEVGNGGFGLTLGFINCIMWIVSAFLAYREQQRIKYERDRLMYTADAFRPQSTPAETMDATAISARAGFQAI